MEDRELVARLHVRPDEEAGLIRATLELAGGQPPVLLATMALRLAEEDERIFDSWVEWLKGAVGRFGLTVGFNKVDFHEFKAGDLN